VPGASQAGARRTKRPILTTNYEPKSPLRRASDQSDAKIVIVRGALTISPASTLKFPSSRPDLKVLPVELPMARVPVEIVTLKDRTLSPVAKLFIQHAHEVAKPLTKRK
jgi:hypothetical protein